MRTLSFTVNGQVLKKNTDCDFSGLVAGSSGYLRAKFIFDSEWRDCNKAASFWVDGQEHAVLLDSLDACLVPDEALAGSQFEVSVTGVRDKFKIATTKTKVRQEVY
jgi:hypothetical protein